MKNSIKLLLNSILFVLSLLFAFESSKIKNTSPLLLLNIVSSIIKYDDNNLFKLLFEIRNNCVDSFCVLLLLSYIDDFDIVIFGNQFSEIVSK